jgi:hypothetical protein
MPVIFIPYVTTPPPQMQQINVISGGTSNLSRHPLYGLYDYSQGGIIYLASELVAAGIQAGSNIDALEFQFSGWGDNYTIHNQIIKMTHTAATLFPDPADPSYRDIMVESLPIVKNNFTLIIPRNGDWIKFDFDNTFTWDGVHNILISWENHDGSWKSGYGHLEGNLINSSNRSHNWFSDNSYPTRTSSWDNYLPNIRLWCDKVQALKK